MGIQGTPKQPLTAQANAPSLLDLHRDRRRAGVPSVSVLRGLLPAAIGKYREWAQRHALRLHVMVVRSDLDLVAEWGAALGRHTELRQRALAVVAKAAQTTVESVELLADSHAQDARALFARAAAVGSVEAFACSVLGRPEILAERGEVLPALADLLAGADERTALLLIVDDESLNAERALERLARLLERVPSLDVGMAIAEAPFKKLFNGPDSRWKALLREGFVRVSSSPAADCELDLEKAALRERTQLIEQGAPSAVVQAFDLAATTDRASSDGVARSRYESLLFSVLEHHAETAGHFELNGKLAFKFGKRPAEIDILCRRLGIAVEVDGFFHFTGPEASRRDRRKDLLLQRHDYVVVRVDADQVVADLTGVVRTIVDTVRWRRRALQEKRV